MPSLTPPRLLLSTAALLAAVGCGDTSPLAPPGSAAAELSVLAKTPARPTGTGMGVIGSKGNRTSQNVEYHGGALMLSTTHVYFIWYGNWSGSTAPTILTDLASNLGGSAYLDAVTRYRTPIGYAPANAVQYSGSVNDAYSRGTTLANYEISFIVGEAIINQSLPPDPDGVYVVFTSADVNETSGFSTAYCGFHNTTSVNGSTTKVIFVGHPDRAPAKCKPQTVGPNGDAAADAMANTFMNALFNTILDPEFTGWYDKFQLEPADKCAWNFGTTYTTTNGARANVALGTRNYLLQQLWVPGKSGYCTLNVNATP
jgi:hypothetical protein